jgi:hypothetical protein
MSNIKYKKGRQGEKHKKNMKVTKVKYVKWLWITCSFHSSLAPAALARYGGVN